MTGLETVPNDGYEEDADLVREVGDSIPDVPTLQERVENPRSVTYLFGHGEYEADEDNEVVYVVADSREDVAESLVDYSQWVADRDKDTRWGRVIPKFPDNPFRQGYHDAEEVDDWEYDVLVAVDEGDVEYNTVDEWLYSIGGFGASTAGMGALLGTGLTVEDASEAIHYLDEAIVGGGGFVAAVGGITVIHEASKYGNGVDKRVNDNIFQHKAEELFEEFDGFEFDAVDEL